MKAEVAAPDLDRSLRRLLKLVDIGRDLDRNREDSAFRSEGGRIHFVLDENVFEMFVRPYRHREAVETFYAQLWGDGDREEDAWRSMEAQAALVTAEFLVGRQHPVSATKHILMTEPHRWELVRRVDEVTAELRSLSVMRETSAALIMQLGRLKAAAAGKSNGTVSINPVLANDLEVLKRERLDAEAIRRFRQAREVADLFAEDHLAGPIEQLGRLMTPPLRNRIRTLSTVFRPNVKEAASIEADAETWFGRLAQELLQPGHARRKRADTDTAGRALWNDAVSIALVRWVATTKLPARERVVLVTGDALVFDTYRRWYAGLEPGKPGYNEPFIMRRIAQYGPIFNPIDTNGDMVRVSAGEPPTESLFSKVQQAVEVALLNLSLGTAAGSGVRSDRRLELLGLKAVEHDDLSLDPSLQGVAEAERLSTHARNADEIRDLWQKAHRLALGASYELVIQRLDAGQLHLFEYPASEDQSDAAALLAKYFASLLDRIVEDSLRFRLPLALDYANDQAGSRGTASRKRLALSIVLPPLPPGLDAEDDQTAETGSRTAAGETITKSPEIVFGHAALRALEVQDIPAAERFAELAVRADEAARARGGSRDGLELELLFLHAVTIKFLVATLGGGSRLDARSRARRIDRLKTFFGRGSRLLNACLSAHFTGRETYGEDGEHAVRYLRAVSERAALHLFVAASFGLSFGGRDEALRREASDLLKTAKGDLRLCLEIEKTLTGNSPLIPPVSEQYIHNFAAAEVLNFLLVDPDDFVLDVRVQPVFRRIDRLAKVPDQHALLAAELAAFQVLAGRSPPAEDYRHLRSVLNGATGIKAPLDRLMARLIYTRILSRAPAIRTKLADR